MCKVCGSHFPRDSNYNGLWHQHLKQAHPHLRFGARDQSVTDGQNDAKTSSSLSSSKTNEVGIKVWLAFPSKYLIQASSAANVRIVLFHRLCVYAVSGGLINDFHPTVVFI